MRAQVLLKKLQNGKGGVEPWQKGKKLKRQKRKLQKRKRKKNKPLFTVSKRGNIKNNVGFNDSTLFFFHGKYMFQTPAIWVKIY